MKPSTIATSLVLTSLAAPLAFAGARDLYPVYIDKPNQTASGSLGSTRNDATASFIGCDVVGIGPAGSSYRFAQCYAYDEKIWLYCFTSATDQVDAAAAIGTDSRVMFQVDSQGQCAWIHVQNSSSLEPKQP